MAMSRDVAANAGALVAAILFGASVVAVRVAVREVPPLTLAISRALFQFFRHVIRLWRADGCSNQPAVSVSCNRYSGHCQER